MIIVMLLLSCAINGISEPVYTRYDVNNGLPGNNIYCAMQDRNGFMWFATDAGVSRFDGVRFVKFSMDEGLCDNEVLRIAEDSKGRIWFLSLSGCLAYYQNGKIISSLIDGGLNVELNTLGTVGMFEDSHQDIWFYGLDDDVVRFDGSRATVIRADLNDYPYGIRTGLHVYEDHDGVVYFFNSRNTCKWNGKEIVPSEAGPDFRLIKNRCFINRAKGDALGIVNDGLCSLKNNQWITEIPVANCMRLDTAATIFEMDVGRIAITYGSQQGIEYSYSGFNGILTGEFFFADEIINYACADRDHNLWFCTAEHGVYCITNEDRANSRISLLNSDEPVCIAQYNDSILCVGTLNGFLYTIKEPGHIAGRIPLTHKGKSINRISADVSGRIWFGGDNGLYCWKPDDSTVTDIPIENSLYDIKDMLISNNNVLYLSILNGIYTADLERSEPKLERLDNVPKNRVYTICPATDGRLWFENNNRLFYIQQDSLHELTEFGKFATGRISCIVESPSGIITVATIGSGIVFISGQEIIGKLSRQDGLESDECRLVQWHNEQCWVLTSSGVSSFGFAGNSVHSLRNYSPADGFPLGRINDLYVDDQWIYVLAGTGLYLIRSGIHEKEAAPPPMQLLNISSGGVLVDPKKEILVRHNANLRVEYVGITFSNPLELLYEYKLDNSDVWTTTRGRSLEFNALSWGDHILLIRARKYNSGWSEPQQVNFSIIPPFYGTWWFSLFGIFLLSALVFAIVRFMLRRRFRQKLAALEQEQMVLKERNRISTDLHDDLGAELSNIVILSRIARSKMNNNQDATEPVSKIDTAANDIINKMSGIIWSLNPANDYLDNLMDYLRKYSREFLELHDLDGEVIMSDSPGHKVVKGMLRRNVFLILKEALQNVHKHSGARKVDVEIRLDNSEMIVAVRDNGKGFVQDEKKAFGLGLHSMKRRAAEMGGSLEIESGQGSGSTVLLRLPL